MWSASSNLTSASRLMRWQAKAGVRLAIVQAATVVVAFLLAGTLAKVSLERISLAAIRSHIAGEARSLDDEFLQKGASHLPFTVSKRSRLWRGFDYRLTSAGGRLLAGNLPASGFTPGWTALELGVGGVGHRYLTFSKVMPDGARLTVGEDLNVQAGEMRAIDRALLMCGSLGVLVCIAASYLFARRTWRRVALLSATANEVSDGRLDIRISLPRRSHPDELDGLGQAFNGMLDQIGLLISQVRQVSTDIAHDLRTPLTRFGQKLDHLRAAVADQPALLTQVDRLETDLNEILRTFDALLQLSQIQAPTEGSSPTLVDLDEVVLRVAEAYRPDIEESGRRLEIRVEPARVAGDDGLLAQCVANLLENALRHTPKGSQIVVTGKPAPDGAELVVEDNGQGIAMVDRERVLKPFVRLDASRRTPGSGLGLSIVAAVAARHGAAFDLQDAAPGLRVALRFPPPERSPMASTCATAWRSERRLLPAPVEQRIATPYLATEKQY